jgi:hypothetical protein
VEPRSGKPDEEGAPGDLLFLGRHAHLIAFRFEFRYGVCGILALVHDTIITVGALSLLDKEFDLTIVAALLTIIGYSSTTPSSSSTGSGKRPKNISRTWPPDQHQRE